MNWAEDTGRRELAPGTLRQGTGSRELEAGNWKCGRRELGPEELEAGNQGRQGTGSRELEDWQGLRGKFPAPGSQGSSLPPVGGTGEETGQLSRELGEGN